MKSLYHRVKRDKAKVKVDDRQTKQNIILYTGTILSSFFLIFFLPYSLSDQWGKFKTWLIEFFYKGYCNKIGEWANSRVGESVSDL